MILQWLTLLIIQFIFLENVWTRSEEICRKPIVKTNNCQNGTKTINITAFVRNNGICTPLATKTKVHCDTMRRNNCKCTAFGDPHYRTYDGQLIHFYGDCKYTLTRFSENHNPCSFNIEVQNEYRYDNKYFTYTKSVIIHFQKSVYELGQHRTLKVNNIKSSIPYENEDIKIFKSRTFLQFISSKCSIRVAFDGDSNAFVEVSKKYSGIMTGICGDCNNRKDDFKTKFGEDVSDRKDKFVLIGNSYNVSSAGRICKTAKTIVYENTCGKEWISKMKGVDFCGCFLEMNNPFAICQKHGHVDLRNLYDDCLIAMCAYKNRPDKLQIVRQKMLSGLAEVCSEAGYIGIRWRTIFKYPMKCGINQYFTDKPKTCPKTCENYFYDKKNPCYEWPEREGCVCKEGFIRDGQSCVKPTQCRSISLCVDRETSERCRYWKKKGLCKAFYQQMRSICPRTCGFCKTQRVRCSDELSTKKCLQFRKKGLCLHEFYRAVCALTCNYDRCRCDKPKTIIGPCNEVTNIQTTTNFVFARDSNGVCAKIITQTHTPCNCRGFYEKKGACNFCTGQRNVTQYIKEVVNEKCVHSKKRLYENCPRCSKNIHIKKECLDNRIEKSTITFNRLNGCYHCIRDRTERSKEIKCENDRKEVLDKSTCLKMTRIIIRKPLNCRCEEEIINKVSAWCCKQKPVKLTPICRDGKIIYRTITYKFSNGACLPIHNDRVEIPHCIRKSILQKGKCQRFRNGEFFCQATDFRRVVKVNDQCRCQVFTTKRSRTCCCKPPHKRITCNSILGIKTTVATTFNLVKTRRDYRCLARVKRVSINMNKCKTEYRTIQGKCQQDCFKRNKIMKRYRYGCEIKTDFIRTVLEPCCCIPNKLTKTDCIGNQFVTKRFKRVIMNKRCVRVLVFKEKRAAVCPRTVVRKSKCSYSEHRMKITIISHVLNKCRCERRETFSIIKCPSCKVVEFRRKVGKCDLKTCRKPVIIYYRNAKCHKVTKTISQMCCCRFQSQSSSYCDQSTGIRYKTVTWMEFEKRLQICVKKTKKTAKKLLCNKEKSVSGNCDEIKKNFIQIVTKRQLLGKVTCSCYFVTITSWKPCRCPGVKVVSRKCRVNHWLIKEISYRFNDAKTKCIEEERVREDSVMCPLFIRTRIENITDCEYRRISERPVPRNCKCEMKITSERFYRCCEQKSETSTKCDRTRITSVTNSYSLSQDRRRCISYKRRSSVEISCDKYIKTRSTKCRGFHYWIIKSFYGVRKCKCQKIKTERKKITCGCPIIPKKTYCANIALVTISVTNTLSSGRCLAAVKRQEFHIKCLQSKETRSRCNRDTGLLYVTRIVYVVKNCKCIPKVSRHKIYCPCYRKDRIERKFCDQNHRRTIEIYRYGRINGKCRWSLTKSYSEDCSCRKPTSVRKCVKDSVFETNTITYNLRKINVGIDVLRCIKSEFKIKTEVLCNRGYNEGSCINNERVEIRCIYNKRNCKCEKTCRRLLRGPCDCRKLNYCKEECIGNVKYSVCLKYRPGRRRCKVSRKEYPIREIHPKPRTECKSCSLRKNNGIYKSCRTTSFTYENCRFREHVKTFFKLCSCNKNEVSLPKCIGNRNVVIKRSFYRKNNKCVSHQTAYNLKIDCHKARISIADRRCSTKFTATFYRIERCRCVKKILIRENDKCCQPRDVKKICRRNKWIIIQKSFQQRLSSMTLFPEIGDSIKATYCHVTSQESSTNIFCRNRFVTETCDPRTDKLTRKEHRFIPVNCRCKHKVRVTYSRCKQCPKQKIIRSECGSRERNGKRYYDVTIKKWVKLADNSCKMITSKVKEICECQKVRRMKECTKGKNIFLTISYDINSSPPCQPSIERRIESVPCYNNGRKNRWVLVRKSRCNKDREFTIKYFERLEYDSRSCSCRKVSKSVKTKICCAPCSYSKRCRKNHIELISKCHVSIGLRCQSKLNVKKMNIGCPKTTQKVVGGCQGTTFTYHKTRYILRNCHCQRKTEKIEIKRLDRRKQCINNVITVTVFMFQSNGEMCVSKPPIMVYQSVICPKIIRIEDKKLSECKFLRSFYGKTSVHCKCQDKLIRTETLNYKCCEKDVVSKKCVSDSIMVTSHTHYKLLDFKCFPVTKISRVHLICKRHPPKRQVTGICRYEIIHYSRTIKNCKCHKKVLFISKRESCCHHRKRYSKLECDKRNGRKLFIDIFFSYLSIGKCVERRKVKSVPVNCERLSCSKVEGPCRKNTVKVRMFCYKRTNCTCVKTLVSEYSQCCGKRFTWFRVGQCDKDRKDFVRVKYFALIFNKSVNKCRAVVKRNQYIRCQCPASFVRERCSRDALITKTKYSYKLKSNSCHLHSTESRYLFSKCPRMTKILISAFCDRKTGWKTITFLQTYPKNCRQCIRKRIIVKEICVCSTVFPRIDETISCEKDRVIVRKKRVPVCNTTNAVWITSKVSTPIINCEKTETETGDCFYSTNNNAVKIRYDSVVEYFLKNCVCQRRVIKRILRHCVCRSPHQTERCFGSKTVFTSFSYILSGSRCIQRTDIKNVPVSCPSKPRITKSKCEDNKYKIRTTTYYVQNCKCHSRVKETVCNCKCKKDSTKRICSGRYYINVVTTKFVKENCRCIKTQKTIQIEPNCPRFISETNGKCIQGLSSSFKEIIRRSLRKDYQKCRCKVEELKINRVCACPKSSINRVLCIRNQQITRKLAWRIDERKNKCVKFLKSVFRNYVKCPRNTYNKICNEKTGLGKEISVNYDVINCKCVKSQSVKSFMCKCGKSFKLIKIGMCSGRPSCQRTDMYRQVVLRNERCIYIDVKVSKTCCCPKSQQKTICKRNRLHTRQVKYKLVSGRCLKIERETSKSPLKCKNIIKKVVGVCGKDTFRTIYYIKHTLRNCHCIKEKMKIRKQRCPCTRDKIKVSCDRKNRFVVKTVTRCQPQRKCGCGPKIDVYKIAISCPKDFSTKSVCIPKPRTTYSIITTTRTHYRLDNNCKCIPERSVSYRICSCQQQRTERVHCDAKNHRLIYNTAITTLKNGQCTRLTFTKSRNIKCSGIWKLKGNSGCKPNGLYGINVLTYSKLVHDGCQCREHSMSKSCHCECSGPKFRNRCVQERYVLTKYSYNIVNCKCTQTIYVQTTRRPHCTRHFSAVGRCHVEKDRCVKYITYRDSYTINCNCHTRTKVVKSSCRTCFIPPKTTSFCNRKTNQKVTVTIRFQIMPDGLIKKHVEERIQEIQCFKLPDCRKISKCNKHSLTQTFQCVVPHKENCQCLSRIRTISRPCECWPRKMIKGKCDKSTCIKEIRIIKAHLTVLRNGKEACEKETRVIKQKCCCPRSPDSSVVCKNNKLVKKIVTNTFNSIKSGCIVTEKSIDKTPICSPKIKSSPSRCNKKTCLRSIKMTYRALVNCKCHKTENVVFRKCCCLKKDYTEIKCLKDTSVILRHVFSFRNRKCHEQIIKKEQRVICPQPKRTSLKYDVNTGIREIRIFSHHLLNCICFPRIRVVENIFRCRQPVRAERTCLAEKGVIRLTQISYRLNTRRNKCEKIVKHTDQQITCTNIRTRNCRTCNMKTCGPCNYHKYYGYFRRCSSVRKIRKGCSCKDQLRYRYKLCRCHKSKTFKECSKNKTILKTIEYVRKRSNINFYDFKCIRKVKIAAGPEVSCRDSRVVVGKCINNIRIYTQYYYVRISCQCIKKMKTYRNICSCPRRKEIGRQCIAGNIIKKTIRSYTLICDKKAIPTCRCIPIDSSSEEGVRCPDDTFSEVCVKKVLVRSWTMNTIRNCKCISQTHNDYKSTCRKRGCSDILSKTECNNIKDYRKCHQLNVYSQFLCQATCGYCEICRSPKIEKYLTKCQCKVVGGHKICSRTLIIHEYLSRSRKCITVIRKVEVFCGCFNRFSSSVCRKAAKQGDCSKPSFEKNCAYNCNPKCRYCRRNKIFRRCVQNGPNQGKFEVLKIRFLKFSGSCLFIRKVSFEGTCKVCDKSERKVVLGCYRGERIIITKYVEKQSNGVCINKERKRIHSCLDCCNDVKTRVGQCNNGYRSVTTLFWVIINGHCTEEKVVNKYSCNVKCSALKLFNTKCIFNLRIQKKTWYSGGHCYPHHAYEMKHCRS